MGRPCDLCDQPVLPGQPRYGGTGDGGKMGAPLGKDRHYSCHVAKWGRPPSTTLHEELQALRGAMDALPRIRQADPTLKPTKAPIVGPKGSDYNRSENAQRTFRTLERVDAVGRSKVRVECPFCFHRFWAFVWSISGGGKKCPNCGSMHTSFGVAYPLIGNEDL